MSKPVLIAISLVILGGIAGVIIFFAIPKDDDVSDSAKAVNSEVGVVADEGLGEVKDGVMTDPDEDADESDGLFGSLKDVLSSGDAVTCEFTSTDESGDQSWTIYVDDEKVRGDFASTVDGEETSGSMINDTEFAYIWGTVDGETYGTKAAVNNELVEDEDETLEEKYKQFENVDLDLDESVDMDCSPWSVDSSMFVPPSDVEFIDLAAQLDEVFGEMPAGALDSVCEACNDAGDEVEVEQCREALSC